MQAAIILLIVPTILSGLPLTSSLARNFEYEYWLFVCLLNSLLFPFLSLSTRFNLDENKPLIVVVLCFIGAGLQFTIGHLLFQLGWIPCTKTEFRFWGIFLAFPSLFVGVGLYSLGSFVRYKYNRKTAFLWLCITLMISVASALALLWFFPQKRITHILLGHIHGPIYDALIPADWGIVYARFVHFLTGLVLIYWFNLQSSRISRKIILLFAAPLLLAGYLIQTFIPSLAHGSKAIQQQLSSQVRHPAFTIYYQEKIKNHDINILETQIRFHMMELKKIFPQSHSPIEIYVYPDDYHKKLWFGGGKTDVTDIVTPSVHITWDEIPHPTIRHELVHAIASDIAFHGLGFHPNMAFTEGLAVALAPSNRSSSTSRLIASMKKHGRLPDASYLFSPLFWLYSGARSYTLAGAFLRHLIDDIGYKNVIDLYSGKAWGDIKKESIENYFDQWIAAIENSETQNADDLTSERLLRDPGIIHDQCPHSKAILRVNRSENLIDQMRIKAGWQPERDYYPWRVNLNPKDQLSWLRLMRRKTNLALKNNNHRSLNQIIEQLENKRRWPPQVIEDLEMQLLISDLKFLTNTSKKTQIKNDWLSFFEQNPPLLSGASINRQIWARIVLMDQLDDNKRLGAWISYLAGIADVPEVQNSMTDSWMVDYLYNFKGLGKAPENLVEAEIPSDLRQLLPKSFFYEWYLQIGHRLMSAKHWKQAMKAYQKAQNFSDADRLEFAKLMVRLTRWADREAF